MLVTGMAVISISMTGALVLLIASCVFGQKVYEEKYKLNTVIQHY